MLKPVSYFAFALKMDKVVSTLKSREQRSLLVPTEDGMLRLSTHEITYIEVIDHQLQIHTEGRVYTMPGTLSGMEETLAGANFARCNKGYLVNLRHVAEIKGNSVVVGGDELLISRRRREEFSPLWPPITEVADDDDLSGFFGPVQVYHGAAGVLYAVLLAPKEAHPRLLRICLGFLACVAIVTLQPSPLSSFPLVFCWRGAMCSFAATSPCPTPSTVWHAPTPPSTSCSSLTR